jgi:16S rRNA (guanine527-N7)-methyltransferase
VFHVKHEGWTPDDLSAGQVGALDTYEQLLLDLAIPRGMIASSDRAYLRTRHILDSLRAVPYIETDGGPVIDLGSGAGLPGLPVAVARPDLVVTLAEPRQARAAFLELATERLGLGNVRVFPAPAEASEALYGVCLARGFGGISRTWAVATGALRPGGDLIYWGGRSFRADQLPADAQIRAIAGPTLESGGPIVIMTRQ